MPLKVMSLLGAIEELRHYLNQVANIRKLTDPEVIEVSQRLDQLLNQYKDITGSINFVRRFTLR